MTLLRACAVLALCTGAALAQPSIPIGGRAAPSRDQPVAFQADSVEYDERRGVVSARGAVQAWQGDRILLADEVSFDRNTRRARARGNVILVEPDGQVLFAQEADLSDDFRDGVITGLRGLLAQNGRLAAAGARRSDGRSTEMARALYSTCNACEQDPLAPPIWQLRARSAVHDSVTQTVEYTDSFVDFFGVPVFYMPYFWHPDPTVRRRTGVLAPEMGVTNVLGGFIRVPYYWVIDDQSDMTVTPLVATGDLPQLGLEYRRRFNSGMFRADLSGTRASDGENRGHAFLHGRFAVDETWRWGFDIRRASDEDYLRDYRIGGQDGGLDSRTRTLTSDIYAEGFGRGSYARIDTRFYQALNSADDDDALPVVLPRVFYDYRGVPDGWGGRPYFDLGLFNIRREAGTDTTRLASRVGWQLPGTGMIGDLWKLTLQADALGYSARDLDQQPNFLDRSSNEHVRLHPQAALEWRLPLVRHGGGTQVIEPIIQVVTAPRVSNRSATPNEDSLDIEFSDANLFALNRWPGRDRLEGGTRVNYAMRGAWYFENGVSFDGLVGASTRSTRGDFPAGSGLERRQSDIVTRFSVQPHPLVDLTYRGRLDHESGRHRQIDTIASVGRPWLRFSAGYLYSQPIDLNGLRTRREEIGVGASAQFGFWRVAAFHRADIETAKPTNTSVGMAYEDECFIFDIRYQRSFVSSDTSRPDTALLFRVVLKTVGEFGFSAL